MTPPIKDRVGTELAEGRYRVSSRIGEGSMGHVYCAHDYNLNTEVVIKFPVAPEGSVDSASFLDRFERESRAMIRLSHPHIVKVIDVGQFRGLPFVVMQYLSGGSLKDRMGIGPSRSLRVVSQNYDQTVSIELPTGKSILGRPAAEAVWLVPDSALNQK